MIARDTITYKENESGFPIPTYHCGRCGHTTEGFSICLKCNPQTYEVEEMTDKITVDPSGLTIEQTSELARMTAKQIYTQGYVAGEAAVYKIAYNEAIADAAKMIESFDRPYDAKCLYKLMKKELDCEY